MVAPIASAPSTATTTKQVSHGLFLPDPADGDCGSAGGGGSPRPGRGSAATGRRRSCMAAHQTMAGKKHEGRGEGILRGLGRVGGRRSRVGPPIAGAGLRGRGYKVTVQCTSKVLASAVAGNRSPVMRARSAFSSS